MADLDRDAVRRALNAPIAPAVHYVHPAEQDIWAHWYATGEWDETRVRHFDPDLRAWVR